MVVVLFVIGSCQTTSYRATLTDAGKWVECTFTSVEVREVSEGRKKTFNIQADKQSFVYGEIDITNLSHENVTYNLTDYHLALGDRMSSKTYIDSFASMLVQDEILAPGARYSASVYWVFDGEIATSDMGNLKLVQVR